MIMIENKYSGETGMNEEFTPNHKNRRYEGSPPQGPSGARRGSAVFSDMLIITDPPRGRPFGGGGVHRK